MALVGHRETVTINIPAQTNFFAFIENLQRIAIAQAAKRQQNLAQGVSLASAPGLNFTPRQAAKRRQLLQSSAPLGLRRRRISNPSAYALGYSLAPLRGFGN